VVLEAHAVAFQPERGERGGQADRRDVNAVEKNAATVELDRETK
jgi:hypothetical protein